MRRRHVSACFASLWAPSEAARSTEIEPARPPVTNLRDDRLGLLRAAAIMNHDLRSRFGKGKSACASDTARSLCDQAVFPERSVTLAFPFKQRLQSAGCYSFAAAHSRRESLVAMGRMCENGIAQLRIWQARQHSHLYHGHDCDTRFDTLTSRLAFAQPHPCKLGIRKHAVGNQPASGRPVSPGQIVQEIRKSSKDTWVNCGPPAHSPIAQTSGALVSRRSLTLM
jgi:hypothetical protein